MNIGLLLTYNEADVIDEMMEANRGSVDAIFALDGSDDGTAERLARYPEIELLLRDRDVAPGARVRDHHRQVLLDAARDRYGEGHWYTLMHGDEIFHDDPRSVAEDAERRGAAIVNWAVMQFFLHPGDEDADTNAPVQERVRWYSPLWVEVRQFRGRPGARYRPGEHGRVFPHGVGWKPYGRMPILKHYPYRSPEQARRRLASMAERGFTGSDTAAGPRAEVFRTRYEPRYRISRRFEGDFGELEMDRQGGLLGMWWRWKRWTR